MQPLKTKADGHEYNVGENGVLIYTSCQLSNDRYHSEEFPQASGSVLTEIYHDCEAAWRFGEEKESAAMSTGIAAHAAMLEPALFDATYCRGIDPDEYPDALKTNDHMKAWLKSKGIPGYSSKDKEGLLDMIDAAVSPEVPAPQIMVRMIEAEQELAILTGITVVPPKAYDTVKRMREYLFNNGYGRYIDGGQSEVSLVDVDGNIKVRIDKITDSGEIWDYKTTTSAHPEKFGAQSARMGYYLKMAMQADAYEKAYGEPPARVVLLAQSTKAPYIAQAYEMSAEQLQSGRDMYLGALKKYELSVRTNSWPAYGGGVLPLWTPPYVARDLGFEMDSGVEFIEDDSE
jgi:hypothetical protein